MKTGKSNFERYFRYLFILTLAFGLNSCSDDDDVIDDTVDDGIDDITDDGTDDGTGGDEATNALTAGDQRISGNTLIIDSISVEQDSWVVVRNFDEDAADDDMSGPVVSDPVFVEEGDHENVEVSLNDTANLNGDADGDDFVVTLHVDDPNDEGEQETFDYDGESGLDDPLQDDTGAPLSQTINVTGPTLQAEDDQTVTENNEVTFSSVNTVNDGWVVLYAEDENGNVDYDNPIGTQFVGAGDYEDFTVAFNEGYTYTAGQTVYPRLYVDDPADEEFTFTVDGTEDLPETYGYDPETGEVRFIGNNTTETGGFTVQ